MKIRELKDGMRGVEVDVTVVELSAGDYVESASGTEHYVANAEISDDTGTMRMLVFDDENSHVRKGGRYRIKDALVSSVNGTPTLQLTPFGSITPLK